MKTTTLITTVTLLAAAGSAPGAVGFFGSYINTTLNGNAQWFDLQAPGGGRASDPTDFNNYNYGTIDLTVNTFSLTGAEGMTYKNSGGDVTGVQFHYRVYLQGAVTPPNFTGPNTVGWTADATFADAAGTSYTGFGDQKWAQTGSWQPVNLLTGLSNGDYYLEVFLKGTSNQGDFFSNNGGSNFKASFKVVPEPGAALLGAMGILGLLRRRR